MPRLASDQLTGPGIYSCRCKAPDREPIIEKWHILDLTPQGRAVADRLWQAWQSRQERILAGLTAPERAGLALGLRGVLRGLAAEGLLAAPPPANGQA